MDSQKAKLRYVLMKSMDVIETRVPYKSVSLVKREYDKRDDRHLFDNNNSSNSNNDVSPRKHLYMGDLYTNLCYYATLDEYLDTLFEPFNFDQQRSISIDGITCTGKSTIIADSNRLPLKINNFFPDITSHSDYNYNVLNSMRYICSRDALAYSEAHTNKNVGFIWDRSRYSNLCWYYIHLLIDHYKTLNSGTNKDGDNDDDRACIPIDDEFGVFAVLNSFATETKLTSIVEYFENKHMRDLTLTFVCRDVSFVSLNMMNRGIRKTENTEPENVCCSDLYNAKEYDYFIAQNYVYYWFAKLKREPCIDISFIFKRFPDLSMDSLQREIIQRINYRSAIKPIQRYVDRVVSVPYRRSADIFENDVDPDPFSSDKSLQTFYKNTSDSFALKHSNK
ncbi:gp34-like protein [Phenacoccus solenopsis nudivirus]|nr:gp34-like protein [Phenacoccus solenopsis nudivirus]